MSAPTPAQDGEYELASASVRPEPSSVVRVRTLEWVETKTYNRNDYHGSKPQPAEYRSKGEFRYTLILNYAIGSSWSAYRGSRTPIAGGVCVSLEEAKAAAQADYESRIRSALENPSVALADANQNKGPSHV